MRKGILILMLTVVAFGGYASSQSNRPADKMKTYQVTVERMIAGWKSMPREVARKMIAKYGQPNEATPMRLIWQNNGPWKYTELVNEEVPHDFPKPHKDMLRQVIDYRVPPGDFDKLAEYDGSVITERTKGEIAARCDMEEANFLALNLAHEILTGKKSVSDARKFYAEAIIEMKHPEYKQGLMFQVVRTNQGDPDQPMSVARREK